MIGETPQLEALVTDWSKIPVEKPADGDADLCIVRRAGCVRAASFQFVDGGGQGTITVDRESYELGKMDCLYIAKESADVTFESADAANPAKFYLLSTLAHKRFETKLLTAADAKKIQLGSVETSNVRTVYQLIISRRLSERFGVSYLRSRLGN